jgi:hypothetical protein
MQLVVLTWVEVIINAFEAIILVLALWQLFYLHRDILAILRVLRRIDRRLSESSLAGLEP